jgi:hypothetical protein
MIRICWILLRAGAASAASWNCDSPQAKLYSKRMIVVRCSQSWPPGTATASVVALPDRTAVAQNLTVERLPGSLPSRIQILQVRLNQDLSPDSNYEITIANGADKTVVTLALDKAVLVNQPGVANRGKVFLVQSAARITPPAGHEIFLTEVREPELYDTHAGHKVPEVIVHHPAEVEVRDNYLLAANPGGVGGLDDGEPGEEELDVDRVVGRDRGRRQCLADIEPHRAEVKETVVRIGCKIRLAFYPNAWLVPRARYRG